MLIVLNKSEVIKNIVESELIESFSFLKTNKRRGSFAFFRSNFHQSQHALHLLVTTNAQF